MTSKTGRKTSTSPTPVDQEVCLLGVTRLSDFIEFVREKAVDGRDIDEGMLVEIWRKAAVVFAGLQVSEAGAADKTSSQTPFKKASGACQETGITA